MKAIKKIVRLNNHPRERRINNEPATNSPLKENIAARRSANKEIYDIQLG